MFITIFRQYYLRPHKIITLNIVVGLAEYLLNTQARTMLKLGRLFTNLSVFVILQSLIQWILTPFANNDTWVMNSGHLIGYFLRSPKIVDIIFRFVAYQLNIVILIQWFLWMLSLTIKLLT